MAAKYAHHYIILVLWCFNNQRSYVYFYICNCFSDIW